MRQGIHTFQRGGSSSQERNNKKGGISSIHTAGACDLYNYILCLNFSCSVVRGFNFTIRCKLKSDK